MFATELLIAVAAYVRGAADVDRLEEAAATAVLDGGVDVRGFADDILLGVAELDRGDITEADLRERLTAFAPGWVPASSQASLSESETFHEVEATITVPGWVATRREAAYG